MSCVMKKSLGLVLLLMKLTYHQTNNKVLVSLEMSPNNLAIINIERAATDRVLQLLMNQAIDIFGRRKDRNSKLLY